MLNYTIIVAAIVRRNKEILLVEHKAPEDPVSSWALPGGRANQGELVPEALKRELLEETGIDLIQLGEVAYVAQINDPTNKSQNLVFVFEISSWEGALRPNDPDDYILQAQFLPFHDAIERLQQNPWRVMKEPIIQYLSQKASTTPYWCYELDDKGNAKLILTAR